MELMFKMGQTDRHTTSLDVLVCAVPAVNDANGPHAWNSLLTLQAPTKDLCFSAGPLIEFTALPFLHLHIVRFYDYIYCNRWSKIFVSEITYNYEL